MAALLTSRLWCSPSRGEVAEYEAPGGTRSYEIIEVRYI